MKINEIITEASVGQQVQRKTQSRAQLAAQAGITGRKGGTGKNRLSYKGFPCTKDCSGHRAGYEWAKRKGISSPRQMPTGNSNSFWEGGKSYGMGR